MGETPISLKGETAPWQRRDRRVGMEVTMSTSPCKNPVSATALLYHHVSVFSLYVYVYLYCFCFSPPHSFADLANCYSFPGFHRQVRVPRKSAESPAILLDCQVRASMCTCAFKLVLTSHLLSWIELIVFTLYLICFLCLCTYCNLRVEKDLGLYYFSVCQSA